MNESTKNANLPGGKSITRRQLINGFLGAGILGWLGTIFYPIVRYLIPPEVGEANISSLKVGTIDDTWEQPFKIIQFGRTPVILLKDRQGTYRALAATCTHLACIVQYREEDNIVWCACHNGKFNLSGKVISGPPPDPLEEYDINIVDSEIWVSRRQA